MNSNNFKLPIMKIKQISIILFAIVSMACIRGNNSFVNNDKEPSISETFILNEPGNLIVETSGGGITVNGHNENKVVVNVFVRRNSKVLSPNDELVSKVREGYELTIKQNGNEIKAIAKRIKKILPWKRISISFQITVPNKMSSNLKTSGGGIKIVEMEGDQKLITSGGGIDIYGITGIVNGKTSGGGIKIEDNHGNIDISTSGGGITIVNSAGNIKAHTSGGGIKLENIKGNADASTSGGSITLNGEMHNVTAHTSGGSINANITGVKEKLHLKTSGGSIRANIPSNLGMDLDLKGNHVNVQLKNFDGSSKKNQVIGTINGGGIPVYMHTSGGGVSVEFQ